MSFAIGLVAILIASANGANSNFKGVATLYGTNRLSYRVALISGTAATFLGSILSVVFAGGILKMFSGVGIVPAVFAGSSGFLLSVGIGAAVIVPVANLVGMPVSTTHGLTGGLIGAGLVAAGTQVSVAVVLRSLVAPLLISPFVAAVTAAALLFCSRQFRSGKRIRSRSRMADVLHLASCAAVSFARGLNDTPKIAALLLPIGFTASWSTTVVALAMATGGILGAREVAVTLARRVTRLEEREGTVASLVTAFLVVGVSQLGVSVSTTHVSVGSIYGVGLGNRTANAGVMRNIVAAWLFTLPAAAIIAAVAYMFVR